MNDQNPAFGELLLDVLRELPGGAQAIEEDARAHMSRLLPVVTFIGPYDSGKTSLVKRLLVDDMREVPGCLTISARPETFEVHEYEAFGCILRDTPGISVRNAEHEKKAQDSLALSDVIVVTLPPQLLTSDRKFILDVLSGRLFAERGITFPPSALHVVLARMDEAGVSPLDDCEEYVKLRERKLVELRELLMRERIDPDAIHFHAVCADPFQETKHVRQPLRDIFDAYRSWDGALALEHVLTGLRAVLGVLRAGALERYFALTATQARAVIEVEMDRHEAALRVCRDDVERLSLFEKQLDAVSKAARSSLDACVEAEILAAARMHGLSHEEVVKHTDAALGKALERWRDDYDSRMLHLAREAGQDLEARRASGGRRSLHDLLGDARTGQADTGDDSRSASKKLVEGLRRFGPRLADAVRCLHEANLGISLDQARKDLARIEELGTFEKYIKEKGRNRLLRNPAQAAEASSAVRIHRFVSAVAPVLVEFAALYAEQQQERSAATERARKIEALRTRIGDAARAIAAKEWQEWETHVSDFQASLEDRRRPLERLVPQLAGVVAQLELAGDRLVQAMAATSPSAAPVGSPSPPHTVAVPARAVDFLLVTALEEERDALLSKLSGYRKLDRDGSGAHTYYEAEVATKRQDGATYRVIVTSLSGMGPTKAAIKASAVIQRWSPPYVLMVGIAGGVEGEATLGDVMVASQIADYTRGKVSAEGPREERWVTHPADADLFDAAANFPIGWEDLVRHERPDGGSPKRRAGVIASGGDVISSKEQIALYRKDLPKLIGVEMEGGGMAEGLHDDIKRPRFLMIRGVSDLADGQNNAETKKLWRAYACHVAAAYALGLLRDGPVGAKP